MASNRDWNEIFLRDKVDDSKYCEINRNIYNEVTKDSYKNLDACVAHAIATGNHTAFVHFFMKKAKRQKEVFLNIFWKYIEEYENAAELLSSRDTVIDYLDVLDRLHLIENITVVLLAFFCI